MPVLAAAERQLRRKTELENDVHIALVAQANGQECDSVTAEISPHFAWILGTRLVMTRSTSPKPRIHT
jgi:hypothetical protein